MLVERLISVQTQTFVLSQHEVFYSVTGVGLERVQRHGKPEGLDLT